MAKKLNFGRKKAKAGKKRDRGTEFNFGANVRRRGGKGGGS